MDNITKFLEKYLTPVGAKLANNKPLTAIRDGIAMAMPLIIIGSAAMLIANGFAIDSFKGWLVETGVFDWLVKVVNSTFGLIGIVSVFGIAYRYAQSLKVEPTSAGILSLASFILVTPDLIAKDGTGISFGYLGAAGLFAAILVSLLTTKVFSIFVKRDIQIKMPDGVPPAVSASFAALIPGAVIIIGWGAVYALLAMTPFHNIHQILQVLLGQPLTAFGGSLAGALVVTILTSLFWFVGVHGGNVTGAIMSPIWLAMMAQNLKVYEANPNATMPHIVTQPFMDMFVYLGGGGATFGLVIAILIAAKSAKLKMMKPLITAPGIFNINEPTMFGVPVVLNVKLIIPFVLAPVVNAIIAFVTMSTGMVHATVGIVIPWVMPPVISGFLATGSHISGAVLQIVLIVIDVLLYLPFVKVMDTDELKLEATAEA